jgi:hypothetical protein
MANKIVKTFEEFLSIEIENSDVHLHFNGSEEPKMIEPETMGTQDEIIIDSPTIALTPKSHIEYGEEEMDSDEEEYKEEEEESGEEDSDEE